MCIRDRAKAEVELRQLAEKANIPVATSLLGVGTFPATHPLSLSWGAVSYTHLDVYKRQPSATAT